MPIQSGAQGVIKLAMAEVVPLVEYYQSLGEKCIPLLQIHDELLFELSQKIAEEFCHEVRQIMQNAVRLLIPIGSSRDTAYTWGDLK
jgi:DNA polymerase-1